MLKRERPLARDRPHPAPPQLALRPTNIVALLVFS